MLKYADSLQMHPYLPFCLYVAARVFVQFLRKASEDSEIRASLDFLLTAMEWLKRNNPLSESFLIQLKLDIRGSGLDVLLHNPDLTSSRVEVSPSRVSQKCRPLRSAKLVQCGVQNVEQMYCALNLGQNVEAAAMLRPGGPGLPGPGVCFPTDPEGNIVRAPAPYGIFPGESGNGGLRGSAGNFSGGWHTHSSAPDTGEDPSLPSNPTPSNLTPGDSQHASSATSYSPRLEDDSKTHPFDPSASKIAYKPIPSGRDGTYVGNPSSILNRDGSSKDSFSMPNDEKSNSNSHDFQASGWTFGTGNTPLASRIGSPADGQWSNPNVLPLPVWANNQSTEDDGNINWKANQRDSPQYGYKSGFLMNSSVPALNGKDPFQIDFYHDGENVDQDQRR